MGSLWRRQQSKIFTGFRAIPRFDRPVLLIWGEECRFFPMPHARRLAADFPHATLVPVPGARTWAPVDNPAAVAGAIAEFARASALTGRKSL